jgi:2-(1,2-epoxy-1,2-dihydrophenyl)acetyl-CoA isomerase
MKEPLIQVDVTATEAMVHLNRPERHNALVPELLEALTAALDSEPVCSAPCVILAANGRSFSTGGDLGGFWKHRNRIAEYASNLVGQLNDVMLALYTHPAPIACAVHGQVTGGSLGLLLACDRIFMHESATIRPWYATVGFSPDGGWTALLPAAIGERKALAWLVDDTEASAEACRTMGLVHEVTAQNPVGAARAWSQKVATRPAGSIRNARRLVRRPTAEIAQRLEAERKAFVQQIQTPEARAGLARFLGR